MLLLKGLASFLEVSRSSFTFPTYFYRVLASRLLLQPTRFRLLTAGKTG